MKTSELCDIYKSRENFRWSVNTDFVGKGKVTFPPTWNSITTCLLEESNMGITGESKTGIKIHANYGTGRPKRSSRNLIET
jgi:hypothetical protein